MTSASYLATHHGVPCAGVHIILDMHGVQAELLRDQQLIEDAMHECVRKANATLLHIHTHVFEQGGGISGVAVLAESHISVHTWPENNFAAFDVFMCGKADPYACIEVLKKHFDANDMRVRDIARGAGIV